MIESIAPITSELPAMNAASKAEKSDFSRWLGSEINQLNVNMTGAELGLTQLATGESGNLHNVMLDLHKAKVEFQLAVQIRNKVLEGYQEVMRMQI
jgi:flagellar hook-basal body complex protein FliE